MSFYTVPLTTLRGLINKGHSRSVNLKKNILASFIIRGGSIAVSLVLVPLSISYINPTQYGIWLTLTSIIGWFGFFDIGFGNGLRNKFTEAVTTGQHQLARSYVSTTYAILAIIIFFVLLLFFIVNPFINWAKILNAPAGMAGELSVLALLVFVFFCIQFVLQLITTIITANQQPAKASFFNFLGSLFSLLVIFILTKTTSGNLIYLGWALGFTPVFVLSLSSLWFYTHDYRQYLPSIKFVKFSYARSLMSLGLKFFVIQIAFIVLYETSNLIIAHLFGPAQVTPYNIAYKYFGIIPMVSGIILMPFWSAFTEAYSKKDITWIRSIMKRLKLLWVLISTFGIIMLVISPFAFKLWVGKEVVVPISISVVMAVYVIINAWNGIYSQFLNGVGKIRLQLNIAVIGSLINIPLAIFLGKNIGIYGVVLSTTIVSLMSAILLPVQYGKVIENTARGIWAK